MKQEDQIRVPAAVAHRSRLLLRDPFSVHHRFGPANDAFHPDGLRNGLGDGAFDRVVDAEANGNAVRNGIGFEIFDADGGRLGSRNEIFNGDGSRNGNGSGSDNGNSNGHGNGNRSRYEIFDGDGDGDRDGHGNGNRNGSNRNVIFNGDADGNGNGNGSRNEIFNRNGIGDGSKDQIFNGNGNGNGNGNRNGSRSRNEIFNGNGNGNRSGIEIFTGNGNGDGRRNEIFNGNRSSNEIFDGNGNRDGRRNEIFNGNGNGNSNGNGNGSGNEIFNGNRNGDGRRDAIFNGNGNKNGILNGNGDGTGNRSKNRNGNGNGSVECPRCDSKNTKFCYYNNYNLCQPRHFCKACKRYWTKGGTLRNVPVGGGCRKNNYPSKNAQNTAKTSPANLMQPPSRFLDLLSLPDHALLTHCHSLNGPLHPTTSVESPYLLASSDGFPKQEVLDSMLGTTRDECRAACDGNETIGAYNTTMLDIGKSTKLISSPLQWSMQQHQRLPLPLMTMTDDGGPLMESINISAPSYTNNYHLPFKRSVLMMMQDGNTRDEEQEKKKKAVPPPPDESVTFLDWQVPPPAAVASSSSSQGFFEDPWNDLSHYGYGQGPFA